MVPITISSVTYYGMLLNSKYKDSDGEHPDGVWNIFHYGDDEVKYATQLGRSEIHSATELRQIRKAALREISSSADDNAATGTVDLVVREASVSGCTSSIAEAEGKQVSLKKDYVQYAKGSLTQTSIGIGSAHGQ